LHCLAAGDSPAHIAADPGRSSFVYDSASAVPNFIDFQKGATSDENQKSFRLLDVRSVGFVTMKTRRFIGRRRNIGFHCKFEEHGRAHLFELTALRTDIHHLSPLHGYDDP
jgi:hypothetical protein